MLRDYINETGLEDISFALDNVSDIYGIDRELLESSLENEFDVLTSNLELNVNNSITIVAGYDSKKSNPHLMIMDENTDTIYGEINFDKAIDAIEKNEPFTLITENVPAVVTEQKTIEDLIGDIEGHDKSRGSIRDEVVDIIKASTNNREVSIPKDAFEAPTLKIDDQTKADAKALLRAANKELTFAQLKEKKGLIKDAIYDLDVQRERIAKEVTKIVNELKTKDMDQSIVNRLAEINKITEKITASRIEKEKELPSVIEMVRKYVTEKVKESKLATTVNNTIERIKVNINIRKAVALQTQIMQKKQLEQLRLERGAINDTKALLAVSNMERNRRANEAVNYYIDLNNRNRYIGLEAIAVTVFEKETAIRGAIQNIGKIINHEEYDNAKYTKLQEAIIKHLDNKVVSYDDKAAEHKETYERLKENRINDIDDVQQERADAKVYDATSSWDNFTKNITVLAGENGLTVKDMAGGQALRDEYLAVKDEKIENAGYAENKQGKYSHKMNAVKKETGEKMTFDEYMDSQRQKAGEFEKKNDLKDLPKDFNERLKAVHKIAEERRKEKKLDRKTKQETHKNKDVEIRER